MQFHCSVDPQNQMFTELHSLIAYCTVTALIGPMAMNVSYDCASTIDAKNIDEATVVHCMGHFIIVQDHTLLSL